MAELALRVVRHPAVLLAVRVPRAVPLLVVARLLPRVHLALPVHPARAEIVLRITQEIHIQQGMWLLTRVDTTVVR